MVLFGSGCGGCIELSNQRRARGVVPLASVGDGDLLAGRACGMERNARL